MQEQIKERYINLFTDFGFKKLFGEEPNKDLLKDFLNTCLKKHNQEIKTLEYKKNEHLGTTDIDRNVVFDLYCENEKGEKFIVELQKSKQTYFKDRVLFYSTFPIQEQAKKGDWNYKLNSVYAIAILDFTFDDIDRDKVVVNRVKLMDIDTKKVFYEKYQFVFLQVPNFDKTLEQLETNFDKWLYIFKNLHKLDSLPEKLQTKIFKKVFKIAEYTKLSREERVKYSDSIKYYRDLKNSFDTAMLDGRSEAYTELMPVIEQKNLQLEQKELHIEQQELQIKQQKKEFEKELQKEHLKLIQIAKNLKTAGMENMKISEITQLSIAIIEKL